MKKRILALLLLAAILIGLNGCGLLEDRINDLVQAIDTIETNRTNAKGFSRFLDDRTAFSKSLDALGVERSGVTIRYGKDDHGGFHGDGTTFIIAELPAFPAQIETSADWRPLPLSAPLTEFIEFYVSDELIDENGSSLLPEITHGYYCFVDRHSESTDPKDDSELLHRYSFNLTLSILDTDTDILYYIAFDT